MSRGKVWGNYGRERKPPPTEKVRLVFGVSEVCPACNGRGSKAGLECRTCRGARVINRELRDDREGTDLRVSEHGPEVVERRPETGPGSEVG